MVLFLCFCSVSLYDPLCALALCVYLCVGLLYIDIVYCTSLYFCMWLPVCVINDDDDDDNNNNNNNNAANTRIEDG